MSDMSNRLNDKRALRILLLLRKGQCQIQATAKDEIVLLDAGDFGAVAENISFLMELSRESLVSMTENGSIKLAKAGEELLISRRRENGCTGKMDAQSDYGTRTIMTGEGAETVVVNNAESPLAMLARRKNRNGLRFLSAPEFRAGERLRSDYSRGHLMPSLGMNWGSVRGSSGQGARDVNGIAELTDAALAARQRVEKAIEAVGPELAGVLIDVCCFLKGLEQVEAERAWPARSAKIILKSALSALARHYEPKHLQGIAKPTILHWGSADYRPRFM